jgi:Tfp pilus assembly protein PilN
MRFRNPLTTIGTGAGIEIRGDDLAVALVRSRWKKVAVLGSTVIRDFRKRPPAEWGREYLEFVKAHGCPDLPATLCLPRSQVVFRRLNLPPMSPSEQRSAVRLQVDSLHPYGEDAVYWGSGAIEGTAAVAVVIAERGLVEGYADLFQEAGVKLRGCTVAAAACYGAIRILGLEQRPILILDRNGSSCELYGESRTGMLVSSTFEETALPLEKALAAAQSELRLEEAVEVASPEEVLGDRGVPASTFAIALAGACPRYGWRLNLLPKERRASTARWPVAATAATATLTGAVALLLWLRGPVQDRRYVQALQAEIRRLEAVEREVRALERQTERARGRRSQLENFRRRPEADLALVTEVSRRLPNSASLVLIQANEETAELAGTTDSAAPLLGLLDASGVLTGATFVGSIGRQETREVFRIRAARRAAGSSPPSPALVAAAPR